MEKRCTICGFYEYFHEIAATCMVQDIRAAIQSYEHLKSSFDSTQDVENNLLWLRSMEDHWLSFI